MPTLDRRDDVFVLTLGDDENRLSFDFMQQVNAILDEVEATPGTALVTTGVGKQYSSGLDLAWLSDPANGPRAGDYLAEIDRLLSRFLTFPAYTVAALNGHTFAAGAMLAAAHDYRIMREDRGYWCLPEVTLGLPFGPGMLALLREKVPTVGLHEAMISGARFTGGQASELGLVHETAAEAEVLEVAIARAAIHSDKGRHIMGLLKRNLHEPAVTALAASAGSGNE